MENATSNKDTNELQYDYIRLTYPDIHGAHKGKTVPARNLKEMEGEGIMLACVANLLGPRAELWVPKCWSDLYYPNVSMTPILSTLHPLPWACQGRYRVGQVFCEMTQLDGSPQPADPRHVARQQLNELDKLGFSIKSAFEMEMILFDKKTMQPITEGVDLFSHFVMQPFEEFFADLDNSLQAMGVNLEVWHPEYRAGQFEIPLRPADGLKGADDAFLLKHTMKELADTKGFYASFMSKINMHESGNGTHFNFSVWKKDTGANAFYDANNPDNLSEMAKYWAGGVIHHAKALTALCCPTVNCYRRLHQPWSPSDAWWAIDDRSTALRVKNYNAKSTYMENRLPSGLCNPYYVLAATIAAGIDGIKNKIIIPPGKAGAEKLPASLDEALQCLEADTSLTEALGPQFVEWFIGNKRDIEIAKFKDITPDEEKLKAEVEEYGKLL